MCTRPRWAEPAPSRDLRGRPARPLRRARAPACCAAELVVRSPRARRSPSRLQGATAAPATINSRVTGQWRSRNATLALTLANGITLPVNATLHDHRQRRHRSGDRHVRGSPEGAHVIVDRRQRSRSPIAAATATTSSSTDDVGAADLLPRRRRDRRVLRRRRADRESERRRDAPVTLTFLQEGGGTVVEQRTMPAQVAR